MRKIKVLSINPTGGGIPGYITVSGDFTGAFQGKFYRNPATAAGLPWYTNPAPAGYDAIVATQFDITGNTKYNGRYTVYTPAGASDTPSSAVSGGITRINVNELISPVIVSDAPTSSTDGYLTNVSTYLIDTGAGIVVVPPGVDITSYPVELMGRYSSGWGEGVLQNTVNQARTFAAPSAPSNPFVGQQWFDTVDSQVRIWNGSTWDLLNHQSFGTTFHFTQGSPSTTWTVNHGLGLPAPFIAFVQFFVDRGAGPKMIIPSDVTFVSTNQLTVSFTNAEIGYVLVRA